MPPANVPPQPQTPADPPRRPVGRPSRLTPERSKVLLEGVKMGLTYKLACARSGITFTTFRKWIEKGEQQATGEYRDFLDLLTKAEADGAAQSIAAIKIAAQKDWRAAAWMLEARHPEEYGRKRLEVTGKNGGPVEQIVEATVQAQVEHTGEVQLRGDATAIDLTRLTDAELDEFERLIERARQPDDEDAAGAERPAGGAPEAA